MSLSTYTELRDTIVRWADNSQVEPEVDTLLTLAHAHLNRVLRLEDMSTLAYISTVAGEPWVVKPDGYMGMRRLKLDGVPGGGLDSTTLSDMDEVPALNQGGQPEKYVVMADRIRLGPIPNQEWTLETLYWERVPTLTEAMGTNLFTAVVPDLLLYTSLLAAEQFLKDSEMLNYWRERYQTILGEVRASTEGERFPMGDLRMVAS